MHNETFMNGNQFDIAIIGGGPAGSTAANFLIRAGFKVCVVERRMFPRETVCGEFLSREVIDIIHELDISEQFRLLRPNHITSFRYTPENNKSFSSPLPFEANAIKRGKLDTFLLNRARDAGATIYQPANAEAISSDGKRYKIEIKSNNCREEISAFHVIGAYGKKSTMDKSLNRYFYSTKSHMNGVKFHVPKKYMQNVSENEIQIYAARDMYCGVNVVDEQTVTICFLCRQVEDKIPARDRIIDLIRANKQFAEITTGDFENSISCIPFYGAGDIYFGKKNIVESGIFMIGDAARVIAPLAGDGIGIAMQSAKIISSIMEAGRKSNLSEIAMADRYHSRWKSYFRSRLLVANGLQKMMLSKIGKKASGLLLDGFPALLSRAIKSTRGV